MSPQDMIINNRCCFNSSIFRETIMVAGWTIWCQQNAVIFDGASVSLRHNLHLKKNLPWLFIGLSHRRESSFRIG
jgi:hypothetical protein